MVENYEAGLNSREQRDQKLEAIRRERASAETAMAGAAPLQGFTVAQLAKAAAPFANWATMAEARKRRLLETVMPEILLDGRAVKGVSLGAEAVSTGPTKHTDR